MRTEIDVTLQIEVEAPRADVWQFMIDVERLPEWFSEFESTEQVSPGPPRLGSIVRYTITPGGRSGTWEVVEWEPGSQLSWDGPPLRWMGGGARPRGSWWLEDARGSRTRVTGRFRPQLSGTQVLMRPYLKRWLRRERKASLLKMKELVEREHRS